MKKLIFLGLFCSLALLSNAQTQKKTAYVVDSTLSKINNVFDKKFYWGLSFNNSWSRITGKSEPYFTKLSLGGGVKFDYYFTKTVGITAGLNFQQRGSGIKTPDLDNSLGNPDSTNRLRLRFNTIEVPIAIQYRTPKGIFGGETVRFTIGAGLTPQWNFRTSRFFYSIEDGFHLKENFSKEYYKMGLSADANIGFLVNAGNSAFFQVDGILSMGLNSVHASTTNKAAERNLLYGLRISFMY